MKKGKTYHKCIVAILEESKQAIVIQSNPTLFRNDRGRYIWDGSYFEYNINDKDTLNKIPEESGVYVVMLSSYYDNLDGEYYTEIESEFNKLEIWNGLVSKKDCQIKTVK